MISKIVVDVNFITISRMFSHRISTICDKHRRCLSWSVSMIPHSILFSKRVVKSEITIVSELRCDSVKNVNVAICSQILAVGKLNNQI